MGAHWAVWLSQHSPTAIDKVVLYYGARAGYFKGSRASYIAHFAEIDPFVSLTSRRSMERALRRAERPYEAYDYPGAGHWFAESDRCAEYRKESADLALKRTIEFILA